MQAGLTPGQFLLLVLVATSIYGTYVLVTKGTSQLKQAVNWSPTEAVAVAVAIYFLSQVGAAVALVIYLVLTGQPLSKLGDISGGSPIGQFAFIALVEAPSVGLVYLLLRNRKPRPLVGCAPVSAM
jgi:hypothetical protein